MGCDVHSNVEVKDTVTGNWDILTVAKFPSWGEGGFTTQPFDN